jgi:signal transduction histidine kinase/uncharacterized protein YhfF
MAATATEIPRERDLLSRLAAGTSGVVGGAFLRRLVTELAGALDVEVAFVAELCEERPGWARTIASACANGIELDEGTEFALDGTPCEDAYNRPLLLVPRRARVRYPQDRFLRRHRMNSYLALALHTSDGREIGHIGVIARGELHPAPDEVQALQVFAARAAAELERRRHETALRVRADELASSRARALQAADEERRRIGRDLHDGAQQRLVVLGQALELALRELERDPQAAAARLSCAREQAALAGRELRELARGLHPVGLEKGLPHALAALAVQSPIPLRIETLPERRLPPVVDATIWFLVSEALSNAIKHAGASVLRVSVAQHGRMLVAEVADDGAGGACAHGGTGLQGLAARVESLGGRLDVESPAGAGTRLLATIPLAPWRTARQPFLEFGHEGDGGRGARKLAEIVAEERNSAVSLACEWDLEGGPPRIGQRLPVFDHTGRCHATVEVVRVAVPPFSDVDPATIDAEPGEPDWHAGRRRAYGECQAELAALLGDPDWRLEDTEPMVVLWYRLVDQPTAAAEISGSTL